MGLFINKYALILTWMLLPCLPLAAQDSLRKELDYVRKSDAWLLTNNPNAIQNVSAPKISVAEAILDKGNGGFINYFQSNNHLQYSIRTESFYKPKPRVAFYGKLEYQNFQGKNMGGSAFLNPYQSPIDIQELSDFTFGKKQLESYVLSGGVSYQATKKLNIGTKVNYESANYTKLKDLRHANKLLNMNANVGLTYQLTNKVRLGLNYDYDRRIESLGFNIYGNTDTQYLSLISFGGFWGRTELYTESGYTAESTTAQTPLVNNQHRVNAQVAVQLSEKATWLTEFGVSNHDGYYGKRGSTNITFTEHGGKSYEFNTILSLKRAQSLHHLQLKGSYSSVQNQENVFRRETTTGGVTSIVYYGQNQVLDQNILQANLSYTGFLKVYNNVPTWTINGDLGLFRREQNMTLYPYFRKADLQYVRASGAIAHNLHKGSMMWTLGMSAGYQQGSGNPFNDGQYASSTQAKPTSRDLYAQKELEFFTKPQIFIKPSVKLSLPLTEKIIGYTVLSVQPTQAFKTEFLKSNHINTQLVIGCQF